ncbi:MAG: hypothetical protein L0G99_17765, partial [Propionibacteriales bacterium]|nr:hypothetical protein [Propionibacteriales bacterium]
MSDPLRQLPPPVAGTQQGTQTPPPGYPSLGQPQPVPSPYGHHPQAAPGSAGRPLAQPRSPALPRSPELAQRPLVVGLAVCMSTTAAMLFVCAFGFIWMVALVMRDTFDYNDPVEGVFYHMAERLHLSLMQGLLLPLLAFPVLTVVAGFLLLIRRAWPRLVYSLLGVAALGWSSYWLQNDLRLWAPPALYIVFCILIVWHRSSNRWYDDQLGNEP